MSSTLSGIILNIKEQASVSIAANICSGLAGYLS
jgi:hypothetical protein